MKVVQTWPLTVSETGVSTMVLPSMALGFSGVDLEIADGFTGFDHFAPIKYR
jgi:hypothetical protein